MTYERTTGTQCVVQERRPWTPEEDELLTQTVQEIEERRGEIGYGFWPKIAKKMPGRTAKQCYDHWWKYIDPEIKKGPWTPEEDRIIIERQRELGNQWEKIALFLPGRSDYMVKNRWYNTLQKQTETQDSQVQPNLRRARIYLPEALQNPQVRPNIKKPLRRAHIYLPEALQNPQEQPTVHQQLPQNPQKTQLPKITEVSDNLNIASENIDTFLRNINKQHQQRES